MNIKELIEEVKELKRVSHDSSRLLGIHETVETVDNHCFTCLRDYMTKEFFQDWQKLKKLLDVNRLKIDNNQKCKRCEHPIANHHKFPDGDIKCIRHNKWYDWIWFWCGCTKPKT